MPVSIDSVSRGPVRVLVKSRTAPFAFLLALLAHGVVKKGIVVPSKWTAMSTLTFIRSLLTPLNETKYLRYWAYWLIGFRLHNHLHRRIYNGGYVPRPINWKDEVVIVSGGARGIGGAVVNLLRLKGAKVAVFDVIPCESQPTIYLKTDVRSQESIKENGDEVRKQLGAPTMIVNCAGIGLGGPVALVDVEIGRKVFEVNFWGSVNMTREFVPDMMSKRRGHCLTVASGSAYAGLPFNAYYTASKAALVALNEVLAWELVTKHQTPGVHASTYNPLKVATEMTKGTMKSSNNQFLSPTLTTDKVAEEILAILESDCSDTVLSPNIAYVLPYFTKAFPSWSGRWFLGNLGDGDDTFDPRPRELQKSQPVTQLA